MSSATCLTSTRRRQGSAHGRCCAGRWYAQDGPDGQLLPLMYRHRHVLQALFSSYLGYPLLVERRFARLYKRLDGQAGRGISGFTPRAYVYLALTLAALVEAGRQVLLSQLVADVRGARQRRESRSAKTW